MKSLITLLTFILGSHCFAQNLGENANIVLLLVEQNYQSRRTSDLLKHGELYYTYEVKYDDSGLIRQIIVNQKDELFYDLEARSDIIVSYLFFEGKLIEIQTELLDLPYEFVKTKFEKRYGHRHHGYDLYFTSDYKQVRFIKKMGHYTVVLFGDYLPSNFESLEFQQLIEKKQREYEKQQN